MNLIRYFGPLNLCITVVMAVQCSLSINQSGSQAIKRFQILKGKAPVIIRTINTSGRATLIMFAIELKAEDLITQTTNIEAKEASTTLEGADILMTAIQNKVEKDPANFDKFLNALRSSNLNDEANMLESECCEFGIIMFCKPLLPSFHTACMSN